MHSANVFAISLFTAVGLSHTLRPAVWMEYVAMMHRQGRAGVALYASLHALPGAILLALASAEDWITWVLRAFAAMLLIKGTLSTLFPDAALRSMSRGLTRPPAHWSIAGGAFLLIAALAAWNAAS